MTAKRLTDEEVRLINRLCDHYGIDVQRFELALYCAFRDGLLRPKGRRTGPKKRWRGERGLDLLYAVEELQVQAQRADTTLTVAQALKDLQKKDRKKWGLEFRSLEKRYYEAKNFWTPKRRLSLFFNLPENYDLRGNPEIK
jgi:hypothetical protein